jgi:DNA polymerase elongation subunit (family B)
VEATMHITEEAGKLITGALKPPHDFEYDKVFDQFIIFSKKRYVGNKYEESSTDFKQTSMGIVLKRRDNAPVLKTIYGGAIKILLNERDVPKAARFVMDKAVEMTQGKMSLSQLTITKSLSANYRPDELKKEIEALQAQIDKKKELITRYEKKTTLRKAQQEELEAAENSLKGLYKTLAEKQEKFSKSPYPAHKILADRIAKRDPGNAPASGERIGFIYIAPPPGQLAPKLQGDRIETPDFIKARNLLPDYQYYIEHQLEKPIGQLFGLMVDQIPGYTPQSKMDNETLAIQLLFHNAYKQCNRVATQAFLNHFGAISTPVPVAPVEQNFGGNVLVTPQTTRRSPRVAEKPTATVQTSMSRYLLHKEIVQQFDQVKAATKSKLEQKDKDDKKKKK